MGTAKSIEVLVQSIGITEKEVISQEDLKRLIQIYGFSSKKEDLEFFIESIPYFKKTAAFLESKDLPNRLKYQLKIGLLERFSKKELIDHFQKAISDFNLASKKETKESSKERRLILEFLSLLPISESAHYLATQVEKLIPKNS